MRQSSQRFVTVFPIIRLIFSFSLIIILAVPFILSSCTGQPLQTKDILISPQREMINFALSSRGATAESPDNSPEHPPSEVIDGSTSSLDWDNGGGWEGGLSHLRLEETLKRSYVQVNLAGKKQVKQIVVYTIDSPKYPASEFGLTSYRLEYWHGTGWEKIEAVNGSRDKQYTVRDNKSGKIVHEIAGNLETDKIRLVPISSNDTERSYSLTSFGGKPVYDISGAARVIEIEVWGYPTAPEAGGLVESNNLLPAGKALPSSDEQMIREILTNYEQGYDNENLEQVMSGFSEDFSTLDGKRKADIEEKAARFFEEYRNINLTLRDLGIDISPTGETASAESNFTLDCIAVVDGNPHRRSGILIFNFRKEDDTWKIVSAK